LCSFANVLQFNALGRRLCAAQGMGLVGARPRALRQLTHRICSSATNAVSEESYAVRPKPEHRSAVGAPLAPTAAVARYRAPARSLAPASMSTLRTFKDRKPKPVSREARRNN
jgi:hypothetical protein